MDSGTWTLGTAATAASPADRHEAALAYARCVRAHGVSHPDPDSVGNFRLTPADERRMRQAPKAVRAAADKACFHHLEGTVSTKPLSPRAKSQARAVLADVAACMRAHGYDLGSPVVRDLPQGRAFFGFAHPPSRKPSMPVERACEARVDLAGRIDEIVARDRGEPLLRDL